MTLTQAILNILFALLAFFAVKYIGGMVAPEGQDRDRIIVIIAIIVAVLVFFANLASQIGIK
jgi:hypothetical protein